MANVDQVARALNVTPRRVQQLAKEGMPRSGHGEYEIGPCMHWYIRFLQRAIETRSTQDGEGYLDLSGQRARLAREQADRVALLNEEARGQLIRRADVVDHVGKWIDSCRKRLGNIPSTIAAQFDQETGRKIEFVAREKILEAVAELHSVRHWRRAGRAGRPVDPAADADGEPVGGQAPQAAARKRRGAGAVAN